MNNKPVLFVDSGIGGLLYCRDFLARNPREEICYIADRENFPYGSHSKEELVSILTSLIYSLLKKIEPKIIVLACNTATVSALDALRQSFPKTPFVGTVPAIKPAAIACKSGKIGVLGTERTIEDPYNQSLADGANCEIIGIAAPELAEFVESHFEEAGENEKTKIARKYIELCCASGADTLVLGCTHFLYLLEEFHREAAPLITVFDSLDGITKRVEYLLDENDGAMRTGNNSAPAHRLLLTGKTQPDSSWKNRAKALGFNLSLFCEL